MFAVTQRAHATVAPNLNLLQGHMQQRQGLISTTTRSAQATAGGV